MPAISSVSFIGAFSLKEFEIFWKSVHQLPFAFFIILGFKVNFRAIKSNIRFADIQYLSNLLEVYPIKIDPINASKELSNRI